MAFIANLRHYLGEDLSLIPLPRPAAGLREFLGCIVETVTSREPDDKLYDTSLKCRKKCEGEIIAYFNPDNPSIIMWYCSSCRDEGQISGWEGTLWDKHTQ
jgi:hypothetical protein